MDVTSVSGAEITLEPRLRNDGCSGSAPAWSGMSIRAACAFAKYGEDDTPAVRQAYFLTQKDPGLCSKLFP